MGHMRLLWQVPKEEVSSSNNMLPSLDASRSNYMKKVI